MSNKNTENKAPRITKSQRFEDIIALLTGEPTTYGTDVDKAVEVLTYERELLARKNASGEGKQTATQKANEGLKERIAEFLAGQENAVTATEVLKGIPGFEDYSLPKVTSLLTQLVNAKRVVRTEVKGKAMFKLA